MTRGDADRQAPSPQAHSSAEGLFRVALAAFCCVPGLVLLAGAIARRWVDDDGFINLRIVRNLLDGYGPQFNVGERVEAATSTLWLAWLAVLGALGIRLELAAVYSGIGLTVAALWVGQAAALTTIARSAKTSAASPLATLLGKRCVPFGCLLYACLPAAWDYASSGLETSLSLFWLATSYWVLAWAPPSGQSMRRWMLLSAWVGLGPLIRPDLAVYSILMFGAVIRGFLRHGETAREDSRSVENQDSRSAKKKSPLGKCALLLFSTVMIPTSYEVFRMGYFAALTPNPALAKEAFSYNLPQGLAYLRNLLRVYQLAFPLTLVVLALGSRLIADARHGDRIAFDAGMALAASALVQTTYVVVIGGDYMHGRMLLPPLFALTLPVAMIPLGESRLALTLRGAAFALFSGWAVLCAGTLRVPEPNDGMVGDERGWYARQARRDNPVAIDDYREAAFYKEAMLNLERSRRPCPVSGGASALPDSGCFRRSVDLDSDSQTQFLPSRDVCPLDESVDSRISLVASHGAIGISGYALPAWVYLADRFGLADPIGSRLKLNQRGRPGHEKLLRNAWFAARFAAPQEDEDPSIKAARHVLTCAELPTLLQAVQGPVSMRSFLRNLTLAPRLQRLRVPANPFDAETELCGTAAMHVVAAGGSGGREFRWHCPSGERLIGVSGSIADKDMQVSEVVAHCARRDSDHLTLGPSVGQHHEHQFRLVCEQGESLVGLRGHADRLVAAMGALCVPAEKSADQEEPRLTPTVGYETGSSFAVRCPPGTSAVGIAGRAGALIDAVGVVCAKAPARD